MPRTGAGRKGRPLPSAKIENERGRTASAVSDIRCVTCCTPYFGKPQVPVLAGAFGITNLIPGLPSSWGMSARLRSRSRAPPSTGRATRRSPSAAPGPGAGSVVERHNRQVETSA